MELDKTSYYDLSIFNPEEEYSVFHKLNFTTTFGGRDQLKQLMQQPYHDIKRIIATQDTIKHLLKHIEHWPTIITNGTLMVMEKFFESLIDTIPQGHSPINATFYKWFHGPDYSLVKYSVKHFADFIKGINQLTDAMDTDDCPPLLKNMLGRARHSIQRERIQLLLTANDIEKIDIGHLLELGNYLRHDFKNASFQLIDIYYQLDAYHSMAKSVQHYHLSFPVFEDYPHPNINAKKLYHILLPVPVAYDVEMNKEANFVFLTGANMAGKSTFIKAVGVAVYLAHLGMGVPAQEMHLTLFDGIFSNINVVDNIIKGESYFYNEVQRIKNTVIKINDGRKWLVLIDEIFKGTNIQDAMNCSTAVIKGLLKISNSLFILSTHLYEIGDALKTYPNIQFKYFETSTEGEQLKFSYQLKDGISNDRLGYLILKREKVVELLEKL
ncbi:MAG: DNA mismatch repair protein MutS [Sphingobacteriales bacterium]|nr:DNA mismatch repair protein MutS [Sphingobacteriales bacterium]MBI3718298.1 DNA mismatch repair protein MutS [Sphingobacteriales bacterium]